MAVMSFKGQLGKQLVVCSAYAPVENENIALKDVFWSEVQKAISNTYGRISSHDLLVLCGDFNGELPSFTSSSLPLGISSVVGRWGQGDANTNGLRLLEEAANAKLCSVGSFFRKPFKDRWTFYGNFDVVNSRKRREYDHIFVPFAQKAVVQTVNVIRSFLHDSDHCPVVMKIRSSVKSTKVPISSSVLTKRLRSVTIVDPVERALHNRFAVLENIDTTTAPLSDIWSAFNSTIIDAANAITDLPVAKKPWISDATLSLIHRQTSLRTELFQTTVDLL